MQLNVKTMDTTFADPNGKRNIHWVKCLAPASRVLRLGSIYVVENGIRGQRSRVAASCNSAEYY